mmetsp:Transcript_6152/g.23227  ORF Transcript_6152/g.23227 Transcript_6152/m.23227 type:complete len:164 (-) Transcript_6152:2068-2559(-)
MHQISNISIFQHDYIEFPPLSQSILVREQPKPPCEAFSLASLVRDNWQQPCSVNQLHLISCETNRSSLNRLYPQRRNKGIFYKMHRHVDLHRLFTKEAIAIVVVMIRRFVLSGGELTIETGRGRHSPKRQAKIRPALIRLLNKKRDVLRYNEGSMGKFLVRCR